MTDPKNKKAKEEPKEETPVTPEEPKEETPVVETPPVEAPVEETPKVEEAPKEATPTEIKGTPNDTSEIIANLTKKLDEVVKTNEMLLKVSDKKALATYYARNQEELPKVVKLNLIGDKVIVAWQMKDNEVYKENIGGNFRWVEKQTVKLLLEEGEEVTMNYSDYVKGYLQTEARILSKITDETSGELRLRVVRVDTGKEYEIDVRYIN